MYLNKKKYILNYKTHVTCLVLYESVLHMLHSVLLTHISSKLHNLTYPNDSISGITGGGYFTEKASAVDYQCLPHDPDVVNPSTAKIVESDGGHHANIYGSEYEFDIGAVQQEDDIPCAVCYVNIATAKIMIPAKKTCPTGWIYQYSGYLVANSPIWQAGSEFVCLDEHPEYFEGTRSHNDNGKLMYPVRAVCGSLPCPPYTGGYYVTCVVCVK